MSLKTKAWSLLEQFGGAGVFFITLPLVSNKVDEVTFAIFLMSQTLIALASVYTSGSALRAKKLRQIYSKKISFSKESILSAKITLVLAPIVSICFWVFNGSDGKLYITYREQAFISLIVLVCIFFEIQCSTLSVLLKTRNIFQGCAIAELAYRFSLIGLILSFYALANSPIVVLGAILISYVIKFCILSVYEINNSKNKKQEEKNSDEIRSSSMLIVLIYGITSFVVANGEKILGGFLGPSELATVYSVMLLPLFIPSIFNAVRVTALAAIGVNDQKSDSESWVLLSMKEVFLILPIAIIVYEVNPIYYNKISNINPSLNLDLLNATACFIAATQALNIKSFYSVIRKSPEIAAKIVVFSGALYFLVGVIFVPLLGVYGVLMAKFSFFLGSLTLLPAANNLQRITKSLDNPKAKEGAGPV